MREMVIYCERATDGFWAEPLNAVTSLAFVAAALAAYRLYRRLPPPGRRAQRWDLLLLVVLMTVVGAGSLVWHTLATRWAGLADVIPVLLFMNLYLISFLYRGAGLGTPGVLLVLGIFQAAMVMSLGRFSMPLGNGSAFYVPALAALWLAGVYAAVRLGRSAWPVVAAAVLFTMSLGLRSVDLAMCPRFPAGTHFLWHLINAAVLYLLFAGLTAFIRGETATSSRNGDPSRRQAVAGS